MGLRVNKSIWHYTEFAESVSTLFEDVTICILIREKHLVGHGYRQRIVARAE